jgi:hypothetical protein
MKSPSLASRLRRDEAGGPLVEFAVVFPIILALVVGVVDMSMLLWHWTSTVKATQIGVRDAVVRVPMASGAAIDWSGDVYASNLGQSCTNAATGASTGLCPTINVACRGTACGDGFSRVLARMRLVQPRLEPQHVEVRYVSTGLGYVGRRGGLPMTVTVRVDCLTFNLFFLDAFYKWQTQASNCPAGTPAGAQVAAASSLTSEALSKPSSLP